jgi:hypothetical protein
LRERKAEFQIATDLPDDQIAAAQIEATAKPRAERTATFSRRVLLQSDHGEGDRKRRQEANEDQPAVFNERWAQSNRVHASDHMGGSGEPPLVARLFHRPRLASDQLPPP